MNFIAIDPGYAARGKGSAVARFARCRLMCVCFARPETVRVGDLLQADDISTVVWECPQVDSRTRTSVPAIVQLAAVGGTLAGLYAGANNAVVVPVTPSQWKGTVPKPVHHWRMWMRLQDDERTLLGGAETERAIDAARRKGARDRWGKPGASYYPSSFHMHNLLDAVGIGKWWIAQ